MKTPRKTLTTAQRRKASRKAWMERKTKVAFHRGFDCGYLTALEELGIVKGK